MLNLKESLEYLVVHGLSHGKKIEELEERLRQPKVMEIDGRKHLYMGGRLEKIKLPEPEPIIVTTLAALISYISENPDNLDLSTLLVHIESPTLVSVRSNLMGDFAQRPAYLRAEANLPRLSLGSWMEPEAFIIGMLAGFVDNEDRAALLKVVGTIKEETVTTSSDDGVSQSVVASAGIARLQTVTVPSPANLIPFRTFPEVDRQPASNFIFRMRSGPVCALFEADGGAWKAEAMAGIKKVLEFSLVDTGIKIIA